MAKVVNIKAGGALNIILDDLTVMASVDDPLLPGAVADQLALTFSAMTAQGASELHMEQDTFRVFTHTVKAGLVEAQDGITNPVFAVIVAAKADLVAVYYPQPTEISVEPTESSAET
jgi:hypothetical protein